MLHKSIKGIFLERRGSFCFCSLEYWQSPAQCPTVSLSHAGHSKLASEQPISLRSPGLLSQRAPRFIFWQARTGGSAEMQATLQGCQPQSWVLSLGDAGPCLSYSMVSCQVS